MSTTTNPAEKHDEKKTATPVSATMKAETCGHTHDGKVVSISGNKLVTTCHEGKEHSYTVATDAKVTCDGVACKTHDLEAGAKIRLTTKSDDKNIAIKIDSLKKHVDFAKA